MHSRKLWQQLLNQAGFNNSLQIAMVLVPKVASKLLPCSVFVLDSKINGAELDLDFVFYRAIIDETPVPKILKQGL